MITVLFIHQSSDLYGSDKMLLWLVSGLDKTKYHPIVVLPSHGPLLDALRQQGIEAHVAYIAQLGRTTLSLRGMLALPFDLIRSILSIGKQLDGVVIDIVHSNTLAVLSGALLAWWKSIPHIWHVHEILVHPRIVSCLYPKIVCLLSETIIANSQATQEWLERESPGLRKKTVCVWNGIENRKTADPYMAIQYRKSLSIHENDILVALVGRINRLKGQQLLMDAADQLWDKQYRNMYYLFVGSTPRGQENYKEQLLERIARSPARNQITVMDYQSDIWSIWNACDIAVVPSTEPESFGLVALEAMAAGKPVIASAAGGLKDIVFNDETGLLFEAGNVSALAECIALLAGNADIRAKMGRLGKQRQQEFFSITDYVHNIAAVYEKVVAE